MKITMYDLLGMVKDGKAPKKIKYNDTIYKQYNEKYIKDDLSRMFTSITFDMLNDEIEILDNLVEEKKIPEKLPEWATSREDKEYTNDEYHCLVVARKVDEILDYLDYLKSKGE